MKVVRTVAELRAARRRMRGTVGLVPTMGYLHEGHLELVRRSRAENRSTIVTIFVNPTQFGPRDDLAAYPRNLRRDLALLKKARATLVFHPPPEEIYPASFSTWVEVGGVSEGLEGAARPGHFRGVATVVAKLFGLTQPHRAYFGQKDAQQLAVIRKLAADLNLNLEIVAVPTMREPDGLAMSSRNVYLNPGERMAAAVLWRALSQARSLWEGGERRAAVLRREMTDLIMREPLAHIDYVSVADAATLRELEAMDRPALVSLAVRLGPTRLIDNITLP